MAVPQELIDAERKRDEERLGHLARVHDIPRERVQLRDGTAVDDLPIYTVEMHIDVLVMGALARSGIDRVFIGHTAERLLETLACDILVVKPP
jgi:universal stress protein E